MRTTAITACLLLLSLGPVIDSAPAPGQICRNNTKVDVFILFDTSNSIAQAGIGKAKNFIAGLVDSVSFGQNDVLWALSTFSTDYRSEFGFNTYSKKEDITQAVQQVTALRQNTETGNALDNIISTDIFSASNGGRPDAANVVIIISDGQSQNKEKTCASGSAVRATGARIYGVSVGVVDEAEIICVTGNRDNVISVKNYTVISTISDELVERICEDPPKTTTPAEPTTNSTPAPGQVCRNDTKIDVFILLDTSNSIAKPGIVKAKNFITGLVDGLSFGQEAILWALSTFSTDYRQEFAFNTFSKKEDITQAVQQVTALRQNTETGNALDKIISTHIFSESNGGRSDAANVVIIITDGRSQDKNKTCASGSAVRANGIQIYGVSVGVVEDDEIICITGDPDNVFSVKSYSVINTISAKLVQKICEDAPTAAPQPTNNPAPPVTAKPCVTSKPIHLCVTFDSSSSIGEKDFAYNRVFAKRLLTLFKIASELTHVTFNVFGTHCYPQIVNSYNTSALIEAAANLDYRGSTTQTDLGIDQCVQAIDDDDREGVVGVIVVVTDGKSTEPIKTEVSVAKANDAGNTLVSVGVGNKIDFAELDLIASNPSDVFLVNDYQALEQFAGSVSTIICEATAAPEPTC